MSYTYLLEQGEEYSAASFSDIPPSVLSNLNLIAEKSCSKGSGTESCQSSQSGTMSPPSTANLGAEKSISFAEDSLAKTFQVRGGGQELRKELEADYGIKWQGLLVRSDQDLFSSKIVLCSEKEDSIKFCEALPKWGMMLDGECWAQEITVDRWNASGFGLPAPTKSMGKRGWGLGAKKRYSIDIENNARIFGYKPHPSVLEWSMGWILTWTRLAPLETDKFQSWLQAHSAFLAREDEMT